MATPQIPFITAPIKKTDDVDWVKPLKKYIDYFYQDDPDKYNVEIQAFNRLRQDIRGAGKDITGRDLLYRYFGQLELLDLRIPVDEKHVKVSFNWYDAFNKRAVTQYSLAFEKASIIFNEASTLSAIASAQNRAESEGRKRAFHYFQASAGMFQYINDNFLHAPSEDLCRESVQMLSELMLAQAHECFLESSIREKKKTGLITKLASHATWTYGHLVDSLNDAIQRGAGTDKSWVIICQVKQKYYAALAQQYKATACESEAKYGESVARFTAAESAAKDAVKLCSNLGSLLNSSNHANGTVPSECATALQEICKSLSAQCTEKVSLATRDNDMIYHDFVPQDSVLTPIDRLKAVKTIPISELYGPDEIKKVIGADLFSKLIPMSIHESSSLYSEEKAMLLRSENKRCSDAMNELQITLDYMKLPESLDKFKNKNLLDSYASATREVVDWSDKIIEEEQNSSIENLFQTLNTMKSKEIQALDEFSLILDEEMKNCEKQRVMYGDSWTQQPSGILTKEFRNDIADHRKILSEANESDQQFFTKYNEARRNIDILRQPDLLEKAFTDSIINISEKNNQNNVATNMSLLDVNLEDDNNKNPFEEKVQNLESLIEKLYKIEKDREDTFDDLKEKTTQDDISQLLILNKKANMETQIFASELEKFRPYQHRISATIQHQQQAIQALTVAFKDLMEDIEAQKLHKRHEKVEKIHKNLVHDFKEAKEIYTDIKKGLSKGVIFYNGLQRRIDSLENNIKRFVQERNDEGKRMAGDIRAKKSAQGQTLLKETLNKYTVSPPPQLSAPTQSSASPQSSAPPMDQLVGQTRQMSLNEPSTPHQFTPTPPPKPQGVLQPSSGSFDTPSYQQTYQPPTPSVYTKSTYTTPASQRPAYNDTNMYSSNYGSPSPQTYNPTPALQQNFIPVQKYVSAQPQQSYTPQQPQQSYTSQQPQGYTPQQSQPGYNIQQAQPGFVSQPHTGFNPQQTQGLIPQQTQGLIPQPHSGYISQQPQQSYTPTQQPQQNYAPSQQLGYTSVQPQHTNYSTQQQPNYGSQPVQYNPAYRPLQPMQGYPPNWQQTQNRPPVPPHPPTNLLD